MKVTECLKVLLLLKLKSLIVIACQIGPTINPASPISQHLYNGSFLNLFLPNSHRHPIIKALLNIWQRLESLSISIINHILILRLTDESAFSLGVNFKIFGKSFSKSRGNWI